MPSSCVRRHRRRGALSRPAAASPLRRPSEQLRRPRWWGAVFAAKPRSVIALENPLSDEARLLRPSLVPGMTAMLAHNLNRDVREARLFEQGAIFTGSPEKVVELHSLSLGLTGELPATRVHCGKDVGVFELKGVIESLLSLFAVSPDALSTSAAGDTANSDK